MDFLNYKKINFKSVDSKEKNDIKYLLNKKGPE